MIRHILMMIIVLLAGAVLVAISLPTLPTDSASGLSSVEPAFDESTAVVLESWSKKADLDAAPEALVFSEGQVRAQGTFPGELILTAKLPRERLNAELVLDLYCPESVRELSAAVYFKDKDGLWFQTDIEEKILPKRWNPIHIRMLGEYGRIRGLNHKGGWDAYRMDRAVEFGLKLYSPVVGEGEFKIRRPRASVHRNPETIEIHHFRGPAPTVERFACAEITFLLNQEFENPFDPSQVDVKGIFLLPDGRVERVDGFYYQPFTSALVHDHEVLTPSGRPQWRLRYTPQEVGEIRYKIMVTTKAARMTTAFRHFECTGGSRNGFVTLSEKNVYGFSFSNGLSYYPVGHNTRSPFDLRSKKRLNIPLAVDRGTYSYEQTFKKMADSGQTLAEVWMSSWWLAIEWTRRWKHFEGLGRYNLESAWKLDRVLELAREHGIRINLVIDNHGKYSDFLDKEWAFSPYSRKNGGPVEHPNDFFTDKTCRPVFRPWLKVRAVNAPYVTTSPA